MQSQASTVIIGAGIVGCAAAYHLAQLGRRDILVLDAGPLFQTGGSTSHAPGGLTQVANSRMMHAFGLYTVDLYGKLTTDDGPAATIVGSLETAETPERLAELKRRAGWAKSRGGEAHLLTPDECRQHHPLVDPSVLLGGLFCPGNGIARPVRASEAMANGAGDAATFRGETTVTDILTRRGRIVAVMTDEGRVDTEEVLLCAGIWGPQLGAKIGVDIPLQPMEHQYVRFEPIPDLAGRTDEVSLPVLRVHDHDLYCRTHFDTFGVGNYKHAPRPVDPADLARWSADNPDPSKHPFTADDFAAGRAALERQLPCLKGQAIADAFNGMFSFTPDGLPLLGPAAGIDGLWIAEAVWITHAAGAGKSIAECMAEGASEIDIGPADVNRFARHERRDDYVQVRGGIGYENVHAVIHPSEPSAAPRGLRRSPFHTYYADAQAVFADARGWEVPHWCEANNRDDAGATIPARDGWPAMYWSPVQGIEHLHTRQAASLFDLTGTAMFEATGGGVVAYLNRLFTGQMDVSVGHIVHAVLATPQGGIVGDAAVARLAWDRYWITVDGAAGPTVGHWLRRHIDDGERVMLFEQCSQWCGLGLWGPAAPGILSRAASVDLSLDAFPYKTWQTLEIGTVPVRALRLSGVGEAGWELYAPPEFGPALWAALWRGGREAGLIAAGSGALRSLRLEKGRGRVGAELLRDHTVFEAGLGHVVCFEKSGFIGRRALLRARDAGPRSQFCCLAFDDPAAIAFGGEPVFAGGAPIGFATRGDTGYSVGKTLAFAYLQSPHAQPGTRVEIEIFADRFAGTVVASPAYDPTGDRFRR